MIMQNDVAFVFHLLYHVIILSINCSETPSTACIYVLRTLHTPHTVSLQFINNKVSDTVVTQPVDYKIKNLKLKQNKIKPTKLPVVINMLF